MIKYRKGMRLLNKSDGKEIQIVSKGSGNKHWNCKCGKKNHKIHEGTLSKYYEVLS